MKKIMCAALIVFMVTFSAFIAVTAWKVKEPYVVKFSGGKIHGEFQGLKANIKFDKNDPRGSTISASIDVSTVATGFFIKNHHVEDALDADKYPLISFSSTEVSKIGNGYIAKGDLKLKGVIKPVIIHFTFDANGNEGIFKGDFKITPKNFGVTHSGTPDDITVSLMVPVSK